MCVCVCVCVCVRARAYERACVRKRVPLINSYFFNKKQFILDLFLFASHLFLFSFPDYFSSACIDYRHVKNPGCRQTSVQVPDLRHSPCPRAVQ